MFNSNVRATQEVELYRPVLFYVTYMLQLKNASTTLQSVTKLIADTKGTAINFVTD